MKHLACIAIVKEGGGKPYVAYFVLYRRGFGGFGNVLRKGRAGGVLGVFYIYFYGLVYWNCFFVVMVMVMGCVCLLVLLSGGIFVDA